MTLSDEIKADLRAGYTAKVSGERIGIRKVSRVWFSPASGHYVAGATGCFMWSDSGAMPWHCVH